MALSCFLNKHRLVLLSLSTGLLLSASWPARGLPLMAFVAFIPLLFVEELLFTERSRHRSIGFFLYAWLAFFVWNLFTTWWIMFATIPGMITAVVLNSFFMAIPWWLMHAWRRMHSGRQGVLPVVVFWLTFEYLHAKWELSWSWLDLGNVFASWPRWVQWYEYTGTAGGAIWVLLANILLFMLIKELLKADRVPKRVRWFSLLTGLLLGLPLVLSLVIFSRYTEKKDPVEVVIIQPSEDPYQDAETAEEATARTSKMIGLAQQKVTSKTRFVAAPEAALPQGVWLHQQSLNPNLMQIRRFLFQHPKLSWVTGSSTYALYANESKVTVTARPLRDSGNFYDAFNSGLMIGPGETFDFYHKSKLVPGIERMPFYRALKPVGKLVSSLGGTSGSLGTQKHRSVFQTQEGEPVIAPVICYESIYGDYMTEYIRRGATLIFVLTNDGWWRNTPGHRQHHEYARLRAIEMRRPIVRAASTGFSSFIDQKGQVLQKTGWWETTALRETVNQNRKLTYFALQGNVAGKISMFLSVLLLLAMASRKWINRKEKPVAKNKRFN
ncbi:MAG: apolipoprotein N-acyltransferase [Bacteroides sp.]|nr:apolipoprotein N-acyltransferase [Bacteroides sp.]